MKQVVPASSPQGCWIHHYSLRVLLMILHQKDVPLEAQDSLSHPSCPPAAVSAVVLQQDVEHECWLQPQ